MPSSLGRTLALAALLALAGCGGSPKAPPRPPPAPAAPPAPDCAATIQGVVGRMLDEQLGKMTPDERQQSEGAIREMVSHMQTAMVTSCTQDTWSADVRACMNAARTDPDMDRCADKLTPAQKDHVEKAVAQVAGDDTDKSQAAPPPPSPDGSDAAPPAGASDAAPAAVAATPPLPAECEAYRAAIAKLASCDKLPRETRDALKKAFDTASQAWASVSADQQAELAEACKAGTDAILQSGKAVCGW